MSVYAQIAELKMNNEPPINWNNTNGMRVVVDCWTDGNLSYSLIIYPNNELRLQWLNLNKC